MHATALHMSNAMDEDTRVGAPPAPTPCDVDVVLKPLSKPELGEIRIADGVFAVGRNEAPFAQQGQDVMAMLSRRHARIFRENGAVWLADLGSRNGTTINRNTIEQTPQQLHDGDEIAFGGVLAYRVQITPRAQKARPQGGPTLTLAPESAHSGLDTIVITRFPFLVSKADPLFSRGPVADARQVSYLSRRQAHIFQKGSEVCIEDLGSTNGTFVDGLRLQEHAVPLQDGVLVAFGGDHFTYRVGITVEPAAEPVRAPAPAGERTVPKPADTSTRAAPPATPPSARPAAVPDRTTFVVAPTSFLDIFCADPAPGDTESPSGAIGPAAALVPTSDTQPAPKRRPRGRVLLLLSELATLIAGEGGEGTADGSRRGWWKAATAVAVLGGLVLAATLWGADERALKNAVEHGDFAQASALADRLLEERATDTDLRALATEAALKAHVPPWLAKLQARDFDAAQAALGNLSALGARNPDLRPMVAELAWLGDLERLVSARGGPDAPIRIYADEDRIEALLAHWNDNTSEHQRALARVAAHVPQFSGPYSEVLTHLRKLQSEAMVYLAAIERLKAGITAELGRDNPEALVPVLREAAEKYPRLGGVDGLRGDLARYIEIRRELRNRQSGRLLSLQMKARFTTPPFQQSYRALATSGQLPPPELVRQYEVATQAWKDGQPGQALAALQKMAVGPWAEAVQKALERKQAVAARFAALQQARTAGVASGAGSATGAYVDQLLAFRASLDADEDVHFTRATQAELDRQKDQVLARAQDDLNRARALWQEYRSGGAIEASQRIETTISVAFKARARLLADASRCAQQGTQIYAQMSADAAGAERWAAIRDEIDAEAQAQRRALQDLRNVLEPALLKAKLALLGGPSL
jgi:pSer/pThr/pTyr-binding forkhead associated (FHA) protein